MVMVMGAMLEHSIRSHLLVARFPVHEWLWGPFEVEERGAREGVR